MSFLQEHPGLRPFLLSDVQPTGVPIGFGSYGNVEEVKLAGATCAAKTLHKLFQDPSKLPQKEVEKALREFVRECQLMSALRHPNIVQFLGVCFLPGSPIPALIMERLATCLHEVLDPELAPPTRAFIPLLLKCSILHNIACGLRFLHSHTPSIIHRDLTARNILLTQGMVAKISDLGVARFMPGLQAATMTKEPGTSFYMPPEVQEDESRYDTSIDIFSFGVLALFLLCQTFPKPLPATYMNTRKLVAGRTELQRRNTYVTQVQSQLGEGHPLVNMIKQCLSNLPGDRPKTSGLFSFVDQARGSIGEGGIFQSSKLCLIQALSETKELLGEKEKLLQQRIGEVRSLTRKISNMGSETESMKNKIQELQQKLQDKSRASKAQPERTNSLTEKESPKWPLPIQWRKGKDIPTGLCTACAVVIGEIVYCGGNSVNSSDVALYVPDTGMWDLLRPPPVYDFFMTSLDGQLVLVGGSNDSGDDVPSLTFWDSRLRWWEKRYPPMLMSRSQCAAVGYKNYLVVACGFPGVADVEVLDSSAGRWYHAQPVPVPGCKLSAALVDDRWYISSFGKWNDGREHIFWAHLPTLISSALNHKRQSIWHELSTPPVKHPALLSLQGHLLLVGGVQMLISTRLIHRFDPEKRQWKECGQMPLPLSGICTAELSSGEIMVAGGLSGETKMLNTLLIGFIHPSFRTKH